MKMKYNTVQSNHILCFSFKRLYRLENGTLINAQKSCEFVKIPLKKSVGGSFTIHFMLIVLAKAFGWQRTAWRRKTTFILPIHRSTAERNLSSAHTGDRALHGLKTGNGSSAKRRHLSANMYRRKSISKTC